jgi:hypothetical protein
MGRHVVDLFTAVVDRAAIAQRLFVLFGRSKSHAASSLNPAAKSILVVPRAQRSVFPPPGGKSI